MKTIELPTEEIRISNAEKVYDYFGTSRASRLQVMLANIAIPLKYRPGITASPGAIEEINEVIDSGVPLIFSSNHLLYEDQFHILSAIRRSKIKNKVTKKLIVVAKAQYLEDDKTRVRAEKLNIMPAWRLKDLEEVEVEDKYRLLVKATSLFIETSVSRLLTGENMINFPEGTRNTGKWENVAPVAIGIARIACKSGAAIGPIGTAYDNSGKAHIHFGTPLVPPYENPQALKRDMQAAIQNCTDQAFAKVA